VRTQAQDNDPDLVLEDSLLLYNGCDSSGPL